MIFGIDGCKGGWFYFGFNPAKEPVFGIVPSLEHLIDTQSDAAQFFIDIPVGLIEKGEERECDRLCRRLLGPGRGSSVFPTPTREAVYANSYEQASLINHQLTGRKLSKQTWAVTPKILEIDKLLQTRKDLRNRVREVHPELIFYGLAGEKPMRWNKRSPEGYVQRLEIIAETYPKAKSVATTVWEAFKPSEFASDDILDAMAIAVATSTYYPRLKTLPTSPPRDATDLPMEMLYA